LDRDKKKVVLYIAVSIMIILLIVAALAAIMSGSFSGNNNTITDGSEAMPTATATATNSPEAMQTMTVPAASTVIATSTPISTPMTTSLSHLALYEPANGYCYVGGVVSWTDTIPSVPTAEEQALGMNMATEDSFRYFSQKDTFGVDGGQSGESWSNWVTTVANISARGEVPFIAWQPDLNASTNNIHAIADGQFDPYIIARALECKAYGKPIFIRFAHESAFGHYPWSNDPTDVVAASQRIYNIFHEYGATNVAFVWTVNCPSEDYDQGALATYLKFYPGDQYVDWVGMDTYDIPNFERNFSREVSGFYNYFCVQHGKPMFIAEVGVADDLTNTKKFNVSPDALNKAEWINDFFMDLQNQYPKIKGFAYWDCDAGDMGSSWKLTGNSVYDGKTDLQWFKYYLDSPRYLNKILT